MITTTHEQRESFETVLNYANLTSIFPIETVVDAEASLGESNEDSLTSTTLNNSKLLDGGIINDINQDTTDGRSNNNASRRNSVENEGSINNKNASSILKLFGEPAKTFAKKLGNFETKKLQQMMQLKHYNPTS